MMKLEPKSLQGRMLLVSGAVTIVALVVAGWLVAAVLGRFVTEGLDRRLDAELSLLASGVGRDGRIDEDRIRQNLGGFEEGPGWQWRIRAPARILSSEDFPAFELPGPLPPPPPGDAPIAPPRRPLELHDASGMSLHARTLSLATQAGVVELTAAAPRYLLRRPIEAALAPLIAILTMLALILGAAAVLQLRFGLRPLRRLQEELSALRLGRVDRVSEDQPAELRPLAMELNALAAHNETTLAAARLSAANLAHALKTPIAALALDLADRPAEAAQIHRIETTIRHHLARARMHTGHRRPSTMLAPAVSGITEAICRLYPEKNLTFETDIPVSMRVAIDAQDLDELLGNILDNASRHARKRIGIRASLRQDDGRLANITIEDDGAGMPAEARSRVGEPGLRLDESAPGFGFGLAIVRELTALYGGSIAFEEAGSGGLLVSLDLPAAQS